MDQAGVDKALIAQYMVSMNIERVLPFRFLDSYEFSGRAIISAVLYGWIASRLVRDIPGEVGA